MFFLLPQDWFTTVFFVAKILKLAFIKTDLISKTKYSFTIMLYYIINYMRNAV